MPKKKENDDAAKKNEHLPAEIAQALEPYGLNQPYDLNLRIQQGKWILKQIAGAGFALGCILLEIRERESLQALAKILAEDFGGMSQRSAYNYMTFAKKCIDLPRLKAFGEDNWSKVIALIDASTDEQLKEIEINGINGKILDEYDGMSVREFKALLNDQKEQLNDADKKADKKYKDQVSALNKENKDLRARIPGENYDEYINKYVPEIEEAFSHVVRLLSEFAFDPRAIASDHAQAVVEGFYQRNVVMMTNFDARWREHTVQTPRGKK